MDTFNYLKILADEEDAEAQTLLSQIYKNKNSLEENEEEAFKRIEVRANKGNHVAQLLISDIYFRDSNRKDLNKAFKYFKESADVFK